MKVLLVITLLGYASCGRLDSSYLPPHQNPFGHSSTGFGAGSGSFGHSRSASGAFGAGSGSFAAARAQPSASAYSGSYSSGSYSGSGQQIPILRLDEENNGDGTYRFNYETANGISAQEQGDARADGTRSHGGYSYTAPDGQQIHIQYTADENGFQAQGAHIPTPPPVPEAIQRSIEQNLADEARGVVDDGQYRSGQEYSSAGAGGYFGAGGKFGGSTKGHQHGGYRY